MKRYFFLPLILLLASCAANTQTKVCHDAAVAIKIGTIAAPHLSAKETADVNALIAGLSPACMPKGKQP
jgi:uncharacterized protein YcfL